MTIRKALILGAIACTAAGAAPPRRQARIFNVRELVTEPPQRRARFAFGGCIIARGSEYDGVPWDRRGTEDEGLFRQEYEESLIYTTALSSEALASLIATLIAEDSWSNERNALAVSGGKLTVIQTPAVLREIEGLLQALYARRMRRLDVSFALVPPDTFDRVAAGAGDGPWLPGEIFDRAVEAGGPSAVSWRTTAAEGEGLAVDPSSRRTSLKDYDVNQTGMVPVVNPLVGGLMDGLVLWSRFAPTLRSDQYWLDFAVGRSRSAAPRKPLETPLGQLELADSGGTDLRGSMLVPAAKTVVLGELRVSAKAPESFVALCRVQPVSVPGPTAVPWAIIEAGSLLWPWPDLARSIERNPFSFHKEENERPSIYTSGSILEVAREALPPALRDDRRLKITLAGSALVVSVLGDCEATATAAQLIRARLEADFNRRAGLVEVRLWHGAIARAQLEAVSEKKEGNVLLAGDWRKRVKLQKETAVRLAGFAERNLTLWAGQGRVFVGDVEMIGGGNSYSVIEVPDLILNWAGTGLDVSAGVRLVPGTPWVQVWLFGSAARTTFGKSIEVRTVRTATSDGPGGVQAAGPAMRIELPVQQADQWRHVVTIPAGRACLLNSVSDTEDSTRARVLIVEALVHETSEKQE